MKISAVLTSMSLLGSIAACISSSHAEEALLASGNWTQVADGVYQRNDTDGTFTRIAYGLGGARYDWGALETEIRNLSNRIANGSVTDEEKRLLGQLQAMQQGIQAPDTAVGSQSTKSGTVPFLSQYNSLCGGAVAANLDTHLVVGRLGATAISRGVVSYDGFGPPLPPPTGGTLYARATVTPVGAPAVTVVKQVPWGGTWSTAIADYRLEGMSNLTVLGSAGCTAYTQSYMSLTGTACPAGQNYASLTKSYAQCVSTP